MNKCFTIYTRSGLNRIRKETIKKKTISLIHGRGWIHAWTCSRKQQLHNSTVSLLVSFSINDCKENVQSLNNSPFWEETEFYLLLSTHREWDSFFVASCKCCQQRLRSRWALFYLQCSVLCHVNLLARTVFENICFSFFLQKLTSISRQNWQIRAE